MDLNHALRLDEAYNNADDAGKKKMAEEGYNRVVAYEFLMGCNTQKAIDLRKSLQNDQAKSKNNYPETLEKAIELIANFRGDNNVNKAKRKDQQRSGGGTQEGTRESVGFAQVVPGDDGREFPNITCNRCGKKGHCANHCPPNRGASNAQAGEDEVANDEETASEGGEAGSSRSGSNTNSGRSRQGSNSTLIRGWNCFGAAVKKEAVACLSLKEKLRTWLLLDSGSTDNTFCNDKCLISFEK